MSDTVIRVFHATLILTGISRESIMGKARRTPIPRARHAITWALHQHYPKLAFRSVGRLVGYSEHRATQHALEKAEQLRSQDADFRDLTDRLLDVARGGSMPRIDPVWIDLPGRTKPACATLLDSIPLRDVAPVGALHLQRDLQMRRKGGTEGDPDVNGFDLSRRVRETLDARRAHEDYHLALERQRYGLTRQTRIGRLSEMVA